MQSSDSISMAENSVVLEEEIDENYEPTHEDILEYAQWLGMNLPEENELLWIAREGLKAPLPDHWKPCRTADEEIYYFNFSTGESVWDHPCDEHYRNLYKEEKAKLQARRQQIAHEHQLPLPGQAVLQHSVSMQQQQPQAGEPKSGLLRQASLPPQPAQQLKPLQRMGSLQALHTAQQRSSIDEEKRRKSSGEKSMPSLQSPSNQVRPWDALGSKPDSPIHDSSSKNRGSTGKLSRSSSRSTQNSGSEAEGPHRSSHRTSSLQGSHRHVSGGELEFSKVDQHISNHPKSGILKKTGHSLLSSNGRNFGTWSPEVSGGPSQRAVAALARGGSGDLTVTTRTSGEWTDSETEDGPVRKMQYPNSPHVRTHAMAQSEAGKERFKFVSNSLRRSESGNPLGAVLVAASRYAKISDKDRDHAVRQQQQQSQLSPSKNNGSPTISERRQQHHEETEMASGEQRRQEDLFKRGSEVRDSDMDAGEDGRKQQLGDNKQKKEREEYTHSLDGQERSSGSRDDRKREVEEGAHVWKGHRQTEQHEHLARLDEDLVAQVQDDEETRLQEIADVSHRRLTQFEAECDARLAKFQAEREQLMRKREKDINKLAEKLGQPLDAGALGNARNVVAEEGRALIAQEREMAIMAARAIGEREKQKMLARIQEELGVQLALERRRMSIDPEKIEVMDGQEPASTGEIRNNHEALVRQWKATLEQEQAAASQSQGEQAARIKGIAAEDEVRMLESARREAATRVGRAVEQEERREWEVLMKQMRDRIRVRIVEEERKALQQERLEMLDRVGEVVAEQEDQELEKKRKEMLERVRKEVEEEAAMTKRVKLEDAQKRLEEEMSKWEADERTTMADRVNWQVRELEMGTLETERAKVMDWVRKRAENEGRDYAEQQRAKVKKRVDEEELRLMEILMAAMEERVKVRITEAEKELLTNSLGSAREGRNREGRPIGSQGDRDTAESEEWSKIDERRRQMEMRVADQIASEEAELIVQRRKEMLVRAEALLQDEERKTLSLHGRANSKWSPDRGSVPGKLDGVVRSMETTQADMFRELQAKIGGEKQSLEMAMKEHLTSMRKEIDEREKREIEQLKTEMRSRAQRAAVEEERLEMDRVRQEINERVAKSMDELEKEVRTELTMKLEEDLRTEAEEARELLRKEMMDRVRIEVQEEVQAMRSAEQAIMAQEKAASRKADTIPIHERKDGDEEDAGKGESEGTMIEESKDERQAEEHILRPRREKITLKEEDQLWNRKVAELEAAIEEQLEQEREERYAKARKAMEVNLRYEIAVEREARLRKARTEKVDTEDNEDDGVEEVLMEAKARLTDELMKEVEAEVSEYREKLMLRAENEGRWRQVSEEMAEERVRAERLAEAALKEDFARIEAERRSQAEAIQQELTAGLEDFRAQVKSRFEFDCARIRKDAERGLERVKEDMEEKMDQKVARSKAETRQRFERVCLEMEEDLIKHVEEERAKRVARLALDLDNEEMEMRRQWMDAMEREEVAVKSSQVRRGDRSWRQSERVREGFNAPKGRVEEPVNRGSSPGDRVWETNGKSQSSDSRWGPKKLQELPTLSEWEENEGDDSGRKSGGEGLLATLISGHGQGGSQEGNPAGSGSQPQTLSAENAGSITLGLHSLESKEETSSLRERSISSQEDAKEKHPSAVTGESGRQENNGPQMKLTSEKHLDKDASSDSQLVRALALSVPLNSREREVEGRHNGEGREREVEGLYNEREGREEQTRWGIGGPYAGEVEDGKISKSSPDTSASKLESVLNRRKSVEGDRPSHKWSEGGWTTRGSHRRSRLRRRAADESDDYYSSWTDTNTEVSSLDGDSEKRRHSAGRRLISVGESSPSQLASSLSLSDRVKRFVSEQEQFLRDRQTVIELARVDWRRRMQALELLSDEEERRRKGSFMIEVKGTLEQHAQQLQEDTRHVRALRYALPSNPIATKLEALLNGSLVEQVDSDLVLNRRRMGMETLRSSGKFESELNQLYRKMDSRHSRGLSGLDSDQARPFQSADSLHFPPRYWDWLGSGGRSSAWASQPGSPTSTDFGISHSEKRGVGDSHDHGENIGRARSLGRETWPEEVYRGGIGSDGPEGVVGSRRNGHKGEGRERSRDRDILDRGRHSDSESLRDPAGSLKDRKGSSDLEAFTGSFNNITASGTPLHRRDLLGYLRETDEQQLARDLVKQHSSWLRSFQDDMVASGLPALYRGSPTKSSPARLPFDEYRSMRHSQNEVPKLRVDIDEERELVINIRPK